MDYADELIVNCSLDKSTVRKGMDAWGVYLDVEADVEIYVYGVLVCAERFPVVEFAIQFQRWLSNGYHSRQDFVYRSLEAEESLFWIRFADAGVYIGSDLFNCYCAKVLKEQAVVKALQSFVGVVGSELCHFGYALQDFVENKKLDSK